MSESKGGFTLPGEAGYEKLTLKMAEKWGADVIRDSDGTELSREILDAGYGIYSTICIIRDHNEWAKKNPDKLQQTFLMTQPVMAESKIVKIEVMKDFFDEQFKVNSKTESMDYWQVYDRTTDTCLSPESWQYNKETETVIIDNAVLFHTYTVSFLAYRIWEEISMYNHITNNWNKEHLMQIDPRYPKTQEYLLNWMEHWCTEHPYTTVVRFTSLFYNFAWIWGSSEGNRNLFTDWGSYDFTVSPQALREFEEEYGYALTAEDFVNQGKFNVTHMPVTIRNRDWMDFINKFVIGFAKKLIAITHAHGKKAYVFYDDSWVGLEPYKETFNEFGFDGLIKCVFSGYEVRLCAGVDVPVHELRLHPYLFPVGLGGAPTFTKGGDPATDAKKYWTSVRRALLRAPIHRIGLGGYLHLTEDFPDFQDEIERISDEFRRIKEYHSSGTPYTLKPRIAVLHYWGRLRSWTLSGHFHETDQHDLIHVIESLAGLPLHVEFIDFEDIKAGALNHYDVVINAGSAGTAWSGGNAWKEPEVVTRLNQWVWGGGVLIGINEPSASDGSVYYFRLAEIFGVDKNIPSKICHGKWRFSPEEEIDLLPPGYTIPKHTDVSLTDGTARVLVADEESPKLSIHEFGKGRGIYLSGFEYSLANTRMLLNLILLGTGDKNRNYLTDNANTECAYYPDAKKIVVINNSNLAQNTVVETRKGSIAFTIEPYGQKSVDL